ncbi:MAG: propanediol utilization protein [Pseudomonadota bacterium]
MGARQDGVTVTLAGHYGELLQGRLGPGGPVVLITLPCPLAQVRLLWRRSTRVQSVAQDGPGAHVLSQTELADLWGHYHAPLSGRWVWRTRFAPALGTGVSSVARLAALRVLSRLRRVPLSGVEAALLACEGAVDPVTLPDPAQWLWAPRAARAMRRFDRAPRFEVLGATLLPPQRTDPSDLDFADISDLVARWAGAQDALRAELVAESARRSLAQRQGAAGVAFAAKMDALARDTGALGWSLAHTGGVAGLLFARGAGPLEQAHRALRAAGGRDPVRFRL